MVTFWWFFMKLCSVQNSVLYPQLQDRSYKMNLVFEKNTGEETSLAISVSIV